MQTFRKNRICVYCGSCVGSLPVYATFASEFGAACAGRGFQIVYGGGRIGLMGAVADAALAAGGEVIGIIPRAMKDSGLAHEGLTELIEVDSMHERKRRMEEFSDAFVALPGGIGTLEEVIEVFTWLQLGLHLKPVGLLNVEGFYDPLLQLLAQMRDHRFLSPEHHDRLTVHREVVPMLDAIAAIRHVHLPSSAGSVQQMIRQQQTGGINRLQNDL